MGKKGDKKGDGSEATQIIVIDDHPVVRLGLVQLIGREPDLRVSGEASSVTEGAELARETGPDVAVVDISLPDGDGIDLTRRILERDESVRVLIVTMHDESVFAERALAAGAKGFVNKMEAPDELVGAIRRILDGDLYLSDKMAGQLLRPRRNGRLEPVRPSVERLSGRERKVFELMGEGLTTREIADRLEISTKTVDTYRDQIKAKLRLDNINELVRHAVQWLKEREGG